MSSFPLTFIFFKMVKTTNQNQGLGPGSPCRGHPPRTLVATFGSDGGSNGSDGARDVARWMAMEKWVIDRSDLTTPIGSMVLLYMVTWIPSIYPSHVSTYTIHGSYGTGII